MTTSSTTQRPAKGNVAAVDAGKRSTPRGLLNDWQNSLFGFFPGRIGTRTL
jgi:hypothetical protein